MAKKSKSAKKATPKKVVAKKVSVKKATPKKSTVKKSAHKKTVTKKPAIKKAAPKKVAAKKTPAKKVAPKKVSPKKPAIKKPPVKKVVAKKTAAIKVVPAKVVAKKKAAPAKINRPTAIREAASLPPATELSEELIEKAANINETGQPQMMVPGDSFNTTPVKTEDPVTIFDRNVFNKATTKGDPHSNMHLSSVRKGSLKPSGKKPLWRK